MYRAKHLHMIIFLLYCENVISVSLENATSLLILVHHPSTHLATSICGKNTRPRSAITFVLFKYLGSCQTLPKQDCLSIANNAQLFKQSLTAARGEYTDKNTALKESSSIKLILAECEAGPDDKQFTHQLRDRECFRLVAFGFMNFS